jgi:hypothetical protein
MMGIVARRPSARDGIQWSDVRLARQGLDVRVRGALLRLGIELIVNVAQNIKQFLRFAAIELSVD